MEIAVVNPPQPIVAEVGVNINDLFSLADAAEYVGRVERTFKKQVYELGWIRPIRIGNVGVTAESMVIFTRRMLEEYKKLHAAGLLGEVLILPSEAEKAWIEQNIKTLPQAAEHMGMDVKALNAIAHKGQIPAKKLRGRLLLLVDDLNNYQRRSPGRPRKEG